MAKENRQAETHALEALACLIGDSSPRVMHGSKTVAGVFPGASAAYKAAAKVCLERDWLEPVGQTTGKGKNQSLYRLSVAGLQAVLEQNDPGKLLHGLRDQVSQLQNRTAELTGFVRDKLVELSGQVGSLGSNMEQLTLVIEQAAKRVKPIDVMQMSQPAPEVQSNGAGDVGWHDEVIELVKEQKQQNSFQRLTLPQLFSMLRIKHPQLTLGQFHDGLRKLQDDRRIRLGPFTQALATIDDPRTALFLDREVKYYVDLP